MAAPTVEVLVPGERYRQTEFALVQPGVRIYGACGPDALAALVSNRLGRPVSTATVYWQLIQWGLCDSEGVSTIGKLYQAALNYGYPVLGLQWFTHVWGGWQAFFDQYAGVVPFLIEVARGQQLVDQITGLGENANNLAYHFIAILGWHPGGYSKYAGRTLPAGYWASDGCSFAWGNWNSNGFNAGNHLQFYPVGMMAAAQPCAALAIRGAAQAMAWTRTANGATDSSTPQHQVGNGLAAFLFNNGLATTNGLSSETYTPDLSWVALDNGEIVIWDKAKAVASLDGARAIVEVQTANTQSVNVIVALNATITALKQQISGGGGGNGSQDSAAMQTLAKALTPYLVAPAATALAASKSTRTKTAAA